MTDTDARRKRNPILASAGRVALGVVLALVLAAPAFAADDFELAYAERTSNLTVTVTTDATAQDVVTLPSTSYAAVPIVLTFQAPRVSTATGGSMTFNLWDGSTDLGRLGQVAAGSTSGDVPVMVARRITPSAGAHTYKVTAWREVGNGSVVAGSGGTATYFAAALRATLANPSIITQQDVDDAVAAGGSGSTVSLDESALDRLDLIWWGNWALVGLTFILIAAPRWFAAFRVTHGA